MSFTESTATKATKHSGTTTNSSIYTDLDTDQIHLDKWSEHITYRQLIISSCVGIFQMWWQPYMHDLTKLLPFMLLSNIFGILIGLPLFYLELAVGIITKKGVIKCWDMAPMARGLGVSILIVCALTAIAVSAIATWCLAMLVHSFHQFLPWLQCAATAVPACASRHRLRPPGGEVPSQSFFFNFVLQLNREKSIEGLTPIVSELVVYYIISWVLIYLIAFRRIYSYSKMVLFKEGLAFFVMSCCFAGATQLDGARDMFTRCNWNALYDFELWLGATEFSIVQASVAQGTLLMLGSVYPPKTGNLARTAYISVFISKISCTAVMFILGATLGALQKDYDTSTNVWPGAAGTLIIWADFVARVPGSQFWSALVFFTLYVLALSSAALLIQTIMSTMTGRTLRKIAWAFLILICVMFCLVGAMTLCTQGGFYIVDFLIKWPCIKTRLPIAGCIAGVITYIYGQTTFCEDVFFAVGEYPNVFFRISWAILPVVLLPMAILSLFSAIMTLNPYILIFVAVFVLPFGILNVLYIFFKFRVRNMLEQV